MSSRRRLRPTDEVLPVDGINLNVAVGGQADGPPMLLLHGLASRWQAFATLLPALRSWRVIAPDFRGHGCSDHAPGTYTLPHFVDDTRKVVAHYCADPPVIYGHSLGGWVGLWLAATQPVRAVIVGDTAIRPRPMPADEAINYMAGVGLALRSLATAQQQMDPAVMEQFRTDALTSDYDPDDLLPRITCPVLLLQGDGDHGGLMLDSDVALATELITDCRHVRLDGVGHGLHVEDPGRVADELDAFLEAP